MSADDPFLFDELADDAALSTSDEPEKPVYTSPIEKATFDIMELVDSFFRSSVTVEEYDLIQKKVKWILTDAFEEKKELGLSKASLKIQKELRDGKSPISPTDSGRSLLIVRDDPEN